MDRTGAAGWFSSTPIALHPLTIRRCFNCFQMVFTSLAVRTRIELLDPYKGKLANERRQSVKAPIRPRNCARQT